MSAFRVLVTGSRSWPSQDAVWDALAMVCAGNVPDGGALTVVHGDCPQGADRFASQWCVDRALGGADIRVIEERHPADWCRACDVRCRHRPRVKDGRSYCPMAGLLRNQEMVDLGADLVLAFPHGEARGTRHCMAAAAKAGIPVREVPSS